MKSKYIYIIGVAIVALFATSCEQEQSTEQQSYVDINISTTIDGGFSRAEDIAVSDETYDLRYTIELWDDAGENCLYQGEQIVTTIADNLSHSFQALSGDYKLVIFADYVSAYDAVEGTYTSHYTTSEGLDEIEIIDLDYDANDSSRDCFGYCEDLVIDSSFSLSGITLTRLMAKMTLSNSASTIASGKTVSISYSQDDSVYPPSGYNLLTGEATSDGGDVEPTYANTVASVALLAYDYIFVSKDTPASYDMKFVIDNDEETATAVPFEQNKITNISAGFNSID